MATINLEIDATTNLDKLLESVSGLVPECIIDDYKRSLWTAYVKCTGKIDNFDKATIQAFHDPASDIYSGMDDDDDDDGYDDIDDKIIAARMIEVDTDSDLSDDAEDLTSAENLDRCATILKAAGYTVLSPADLNSSFIYDSDSTSPPDPKPPYKFHPQPQLTISDAGNGYTWHFASPIEPHTLYLRGSPAIRVSPVWKFTLADPSDPKSQEIHEIDYWHWYFVGSAFSSAAVNPKFPTLALAQKSALEAACRFERISYEYPVVSIQDASSMALLSVGVNSEKPQDCPVKV